MAAINETQMVGSHTRQKHYSQLWPPVACVDGSPAFSGVIHPITA